MNTTAKISYISFGILLVSLLAVWLPTSTMVFAVMSIVSILPLVLVILILKEPKVCYPELTEDEPLDYLNN